MSVKISVRIGKALYETYPDSDAVYGFDEYGVAIDDIPLYIFELVNSVREEKAK